MNATESWSTLLDELTTLRECMDMMAAAWSADYRCHGGTIFCGKGCRECCSLTVNCTLPEAVLLAQNLNDRQAQVVAEYAVRLGELVTPTMELKDYLRLQRSDMGWCPLLEDDGSCGTYAYRPLACRALLSTKESFYCGVDFATLTGEQKQAYVESLDRSVTDFPLHYVASTRETGAELEARSLTLMRERFGFSVYGAMPVLLHLVLVHGLARAVPAGREAGEVVVRDAGLGHPFMVEFAG